MLAGLNFAAVKLLNRNQSKNAPRMIAKLISFSFITTEKLINEVSRNLLDE